MDKKTIIILCESLIIILLLVWIFGVGRYRTNAALESLREQRIQLIRSTAAIKSENSKIRTESGKLEQNYIESEKNYIQSEIDNRRLENQNIEYRNIIGQLTEGSRETEEYLTEYGKINRDFAGFIRQNRVTE